MAKWSIKELGYLYSRYTGYATDQYNNELVGKCFSLKLDDSDLTGFSFNHGERREIVICSSVSIFTACPLIAPAFYPAYRDRSCSEEIGIHTRYSDNQLLIVDLDSDKLNGLSAKFPNTIDFSLCQKLEYGLSPNSETPDSYINVPIYDNPHWEMRPNGMLTYVGNITKLANFVLIVPADIFDDFMQKLKDMSANVGSGTSGTSGTIGNGSQSNGNSTKSTSGTSSNTGTSGVSTSGGAGSNSTSGTSVIVPDVAPSDKYAKMNGRLKPLFDPPCGTKSIPNPSGSASNSPTDLIRTIFEDPDSDWSQHSVYAAIADYLFSSDMKTLYDISTCDSIQQSEKIIGKRLDELCQGYAIRFQKLSQLEDFKAIYQNLVTMTFESRKQELECGKVVNPVLDDPLPPDSNLYVDQSILFNQPDQYIFGKISPIYDVVPEFAKLKTWGLWDKRERLTGITIDSGERTGSYGYWYRKVYDVNTCYDEPQFEIAYIDKYGSGSYLLEAGKASYPSMATYKSWSNMLLPSEDRRFMTKDLKEIKRAYIVKVSRRQYGDKMDAGNWQLNLADLQPNPVNHYNTGSNVTVQSTSSFVLQLIDESRDSTQVFSNKQPVDDWYYVVSGSLEEGVADSSQDSAGIFYPAHGLIIIDADYLDQWCHFNTVTGSAIQAWNEEKLFLAISGAMSPTIARTSSYYQWGRGSQWHYVNNYFVRVDDTEYNYTSNPSFSENVNGSFVHATMEKWPTTYITTIGLYNNKNELLAVGKLKRPVKKDFSSEFVFNLKVRV